MSWKAEVRPKARPKKVTSPGGGHVVCVVQDMFSRLDLHYLVQILQIISERQVEIYGRLSIWSICPTCAKSVVVLKMPLTMTLAMELWMPAASRRGIAPVMTAARARCFCAARFCW